jgi:hypothetical protein
MSVQSYQERWNLIVMGGSHNKSDHGRTARPELKNSQRSDFCGFSGFIKSMVRDTLGQRQLTWSEFFGSSLEINHRT